MVDDIAKRREPLPQLSAVYFIQPSEASLNALIADWTGAKAPYKTAHVFLSTRFLPGILPAFKANCPPLLQSCLRSLKEVCTCVHQHLGGLVWAGATMQRPQTQLACLMARASLQQNSSLSALHAPAKDVQLQMC